ncbi:hypothetical protein [Streptomyces sp. SID14478]|nr:hypothetical protein [Streptomyces sp. SID14478]
MNLLINGDAEQGPGGDPVAGTVTGWTITQGAPAVVAYGNR